MSPIVKYDVSDVAATGQVLKADVYDAKIIEANYGNSSNGNKMFTIKFEVVGPTNAGYKLWHYIVPDSAEFRLREFTDALELPPKGQINTDKIVGTVLKVRTVVQKSEEYGEQARIKNVLPGVEAADDEDGDEPPYEEWEQSELAEEIEARKLKIGGRKTKAAMIRALVADDEAATDDEEAEEAEEAEEDEDEEEAEGGDDLTREDLEVMDRATLKALIKEEGLEVKVLKKDTDDDLREKIADVLEIEEPTDEDEEEEEEAEDEDDEEVAAYEEWDMDDLKSELKERGLKPDGRKSILVARLKKDDESGEDPF